MKKYFIHDGETQTGPFSIDDLQENSISPTNFVWYEGLESWKPITEFEELKNFITKKEVTPPPFIIPQQSTVSSEILPPVFNIDNPPIVDYTKQQEKKVSKKNNWMNKWTKNHTTSLSAPLLYGKATIFGFSVFFNPLVGSILLSKNLKETENSNKQTEIILFGVFYFAALMIIASYLPADFPGMFVFFPNYLAGRFLIKYYWNNTIGENTMYRDKPALKPLLICLAITIPIVILTIMSKLNP